MARKTKTRKRYKKGGYASNNPPSEAERAALRYGIPTHRYRQYVRDWNNYGWRNSDAAGDGVSGPRTDEHNLNQFILRRIAQHREQEERERERRRLAAIRARAYRVRNLLPENVEPQHATLQEVQDAEQIQENQRRRRAEIARAAAEAARLKADEETRSVYVPVENPDGSIQMGRAVLPTIEEAQRLRNEMAEIPVTRPSRLRRLKEIAGRVKQYLVESARAIRNRTFFGTRRNRRRNNAIVPIGGPLDPIEGGRRKRRKKTRRKRRRGGNGTKRKRDGPPTPRRPPRRRLNPPQQQQPQQNQDDDYDEYAALMEHIEANVDPDDPNFVQGGGGGVFSRRRKHISIIDPKEKYINLALKKLITDQEWKNAGVVAQVQMMRNLALQLEEDDKKGGRRRKKKTRRKKKNKR